MLLWLCGMEMLALHLHKKSNTFNAQSMTSLDYHRYKVPFNFGLKILKNQTKNYTSMDSYTLHKILLKLAFCLLGGSQTTDCTKERVFQKCPMLSQLSPPPNLWKSKPVLEDGFVMWKNIYSLYCFGIIHQNPTPKMWQALITSANRLSRIKCKPHTLPYIITVIHILLSCVYVLPRLW